MLIALLASSWASPELELAERVEVERIEASIRALTGEVDVDGQGPFTSRNIHHPDMPRVEDWLEAELAQWGEVQREDFRAERQDVANLVFTLAGSDPSLEPVLLGAHYDSTANLEEGWRATQDPAPGADDNASGAAVLIEVARVLSSWEGGFERPVHIVAFSAEEQGLLGSIHHVEQLDGGVHLALILDPVGHNPGGADWLFGTYDARWEQPARDIEATAEQLDQSLQVGLIDHETVGGDERSDHAPFWWAELPALHLGVYPVDGVYHTTADAYEVVDVDFVAQIAALSVAEVARLAGPLEPAEEPPGGCDSAARSPLALSPMALAGLLLAAFALRLRAQSSSPSSSRTRPVPADRNSTRSPLRH